ncbi:hypothetical protein ABIB27_002275 [Arthrobacter sp. UYEF21]
MTRAAGPLGYRVRARDGFGRHVGAAVQVHYFHTVPVGCHLRAVRRIVCQEVFEQIQD